MLETINEDIFDRLPTASAICIPTNCSLLKDGTNPMGALAGAAAARWKELPVIYGRMLIALPNVPCIMGWASKRDPSVFISLFDVDDCGFADPATAIVAFPTMHHIGQPADLNLVVRNTKLLVELTELCGWETVCGVRFGCGVGGLDYATQVKPALEQILDDRFVIMHK